MRLETRADAQLVEYHVVDVPAPFALAQTRPDCFLTIDRHPTLRLRVPILPERASSRAISRSSIASRRLGCRLDYHARGVDPPCSEA